MLVGEALILVNFVFEVSSMLLLQLLLNFHSQDVCIDWHLHFLSHAVHVPLLELNQPSHIIETTFVISLKLLSLCCLLFEAMLVLADLDFDLVVVAPESFIELSNLLFVDHSFLQVLLHLS